MGDIKQTFMDIFFEPEDPDKQKQEEKKSKVQDSPIRAKDILYRKSKNTFINLDNNNVSSVPFSSNTEEKKDENFEFSQQISPIFGVIKENKKKPINYDKDVVETQTAKPETSHLDIITSPIYGYGSKEEAMAGNYDVKGIDLPLEEEIVEEENDIDLNNIFESEDNYVDDSMMLSEDEEDEIIDDGFNFYNSFGDQK